MSSKGYTTKTKVENYLLKDINVSFDTQIDNWIEGVENIIDQITNRNFKADSSASARLFNGDGTPELLIDECVEVTLVEVGNDGYGSSFTTVASSGSDRYFTLPNNHTVKKQPIHKIELSARDFVCGTQNNRITAKWGYSAEVPKDIEFVATVLVAGIINQHSQSGDQIKSERIGNYTVTYNTDNGGDSFADFNRAMEILKMYTRYII